jgi:uncharacterized membrane protein YdcZ (DUF606 family)
VKGFLIPIAIGAGVLMVVQSACNSALEKSLDRPVVSYRQILVTA